MFCCCCYIKHTPKPPILMKQTPQLFLRVADLSGLGQLLRIYKLTIFKSMKTLMAQHPTAFDPSVLCSFCPEHKILQHSHCKLANNCIILRQQLYLFSGIGYFPTTKHNIMDTEKVLVGKPDR